MLNNEVFIKTIRKFFLKEGFKETATPAVVESPLPEPHINAVKAPGEGYFITSPEIFLKIVLAENPGDIFEIAACRRSDESGRLHKECFTMLEWYKVNEVYTGLIEFISRFLLFMSETLSGSSKITYQNQEIDFSLPPYTVTVEKAFDEYASLSMREAMEKGVFEEILVTEIEPSLPKNIPVIMMDYPAEFAALSKLKKDKPYLCERWELYIAGIEIANTYTELTSCSEHSERFAKFAEERAAGGMPEYFVIDEFKKALERGLPESAGCALGVDRLFMIFADLPYIPQFDLLQKGEEGI